MQMLGACTTSRPIDHRQCRVQIGLDGQMGHDHQGHGALLGGVVAGIVLDHAGDADSLLTQNLRQPRQHARPVGDGEAEVIAAPDLAGRRRAETAGADSDQRLSSRDGRGRRGR